VNRSKQACPTSHVEADGQLEQVFPATQDPNVFQLVANEVDIGRTNAWGHGTALVRFDPMVLKCPTCGIIAGPPFFPEKLPRTAPPRRDEAALCRKHQR
jgi:hypothetical protein